MLPGCASTGEALISERSNQCDQIGHLFESSWWHGFFQSNPNEWWIFGLQRKATFLVLSYCDYFLGNFWKKLGYFLIYHLIALIATGLLTMEHFGWRRQGTLSAHSVSCTVHENKSFCCSFVRASSKDELPRGQYRSTHPHTKVLDGLSLLEWYVVGCYALMKDDLLVTFGFASFRLHLFRDIVAIVR